MAGDALPPADRLAALERELAYYRRECNELGARLLRAQEDQAQAFREARRSRTVARLIREVHRLSDRCAAPGEVGAPMLEIVLDSALCDRAALLYEIEPGSGRFEATHALGLAETGLPRGPGTIVEVLHPPAFLFTTSRSEPDPAARAITAAIGVPYVLWAYDRTAGHALVLGNRTEGNVSRPFEPGDQEVVEGALSVYLDVLGRKRAEVELRGAKLAAEEAGATKARFLATLTHELRTPLHTIMGFAELLLPGSPIRASAAQRREYALHILRSGQHLAEMINDILDYSALARHGPRLDWAWHRADDLVCTSAAAAAARSVAEIRCSSATAEELELEVDPRRFRQIMDNLIGNAVRFTPAGGRVEVTVERQPDGGARILVRDTGVGMRPEDIPRALEPFVQLDNAPASDRSDLPRTGTGLGLPIARGLAEAHGGVLTVESAPGRGTTVSVSLPAERVRALPQGQERTAPHVPTAAEKARRSS